MKTRLAVGDIIKVHNPLMKEENSNFPVLQIRGNRAITKFRTFNTKVWHGRTVYEYGKRLSPIYNNDYTVEPAGGSGPQPNFEEEL